MHPIRASARFTRAIDATAELLQKLKIEAMFVGGVARAAYMDVEVGTGAIDVIALMNSPQKNQLAMMAGNRGYRVDREELEATEELDLVPLNFVDPEGEEVRVHVLLASNALYGRMVASAQGTTLGDLERVLRVPRAEDLALLLLMAEDEEAVRHLTALPEFDLPAFRERLRSIGLGAEVAGA
ncbi:MAG TPA: hypothetical protein VEK57_19820 [Thermoanaerobaculia bacterium]|nr:hypothetical protein [Thermoanaerobaculia bacterium]